MSPPTDATERQTKLNLKIKSMHYDPILNQVMTSTYWLLPITLILVIIKSSWFKGLMGEALVTFFG